MPELVPRSGAARSGLSILLSAHRRSSGARTSTGFTITVTCSVQTTHNIGGTLYKTWVLTSTARRGIYGTPDFVSRNATRTVTNAPP